MLKTSKILKGTTIFTLSLFLFSIIFSHLHVYADEQTGISNIESSITTDGSNKPVTPSIGLLNTGFESGITPWGVWNDTGAIGPSVVTNDFKNGTKSMQLNSIGTSQNGSSAWQTIVLGASSGLATGDTLQVGAWIKLSSDVIPSKVGIGFEWLDSSGNNKTNFYSLGLPENITKNSWVYIVTNSAQIPGIANSNTPAQINIVFSDMSVGTINIDDVGLFDLTPKQAGNSINPISASFDKNISNQADVTVNTLGGNTLVSITNGSSILVKDTDYTIGGSGVVTIKKGYLSQQPIGPLALNFNFNVESSQNLSILISDSGTVFLNPHDYTMINSAFEGSFTPDNDHGWGTWPALPSGIDSINSGALAIGIVTNPVHEGSQALAMYNGASLWQRIYGGTNGCADGDVVQAQSWVYAYPSSVGSNIKVDAIDKDGNHITIAQSRALTDADLGWVMLTTVPVAPSKIPYGSTGGIVVSIGALTPGKLIIDDFSVKSLGNNGQQGKDVVVNNGSDNPYNKLNEYPLINNSFESSNTSLSTWGTYGNVSINTSDTYYGINSAKFNINTPTTPGNTSIWQGLEVGTTGSVPIIGRTVEAGAWIYLGSDTDLNSGNIEVDINSIDSTTGNKTLIAKTKVIDSSTPKDQWIYLKTQPIGQGAILANAASIVISVENTIKGTTYADFVQIGETGSINGNPNKYAMAAYQPWFGNETDGWYNWEWNQGPAGFNHDPSTILANGQRDIGAVYYPIVGPYDSLDTNVLNYQLDIAKAALFDGFMVNDYGREMKPRYRQVEDKMIDIAEQKGMKIAFQYETKVNMVGWAPSTANGTRQQKIDGIVTDLKYILDKYSARKAFLKYNGVPVISIFGVYLLTDSEWNYINSAVNTGTYICSLMADGFSSSNDSNMTTSNSAFGSMYNWNLYDPSLAPAASPTYDTLSSFDTNNDKRVRKWVSGDSTNRFGVGIVWPGFNDTGVGSWGSGSPRLTSYNDADPKGDQLQTSAKAVMDGGANFMLFATFNDWNESTIIEPSKEKGYKYIIETQNILKQFKGIGAVDNTLMQTITENYLANPSFINYNGTIAPVSTPGGSSGSSSGGSITVTPPVVTPPVVVPVETKNVERLAGLNRIETSIVIAKEQYIDKAPDAVVLTSADGFADGLAGSELAYKYNAPLLLVNKSVSDSKSVINYITANLSNGKDIYILGETRAVSKEISDYLTSLGYKIIRLGGMDRYETNQKIANYLNMPKGTSIIITSGADFADALSISSIADIKGYPVLLNGKDSLSADVSKNITTLEPATVYIIGGTGVLSANIEAEIKKLNGNVNVVRLGGKDRYETSLKIAEYFNLTTNTITIASGISFPDALSGSVLAARSNSSVLLVDNKDITSQNSFINRQKITNVIVFGGEGVISSGIVSSLIK